MRRLFEMLGIKKPTHTHELRRINYEGDGKYTTTIFVKGTQDECYAVLKKHADKDGFGIGLLLNNGGYRVVDLAEEIIQFKKSAGVELYDALVEVSKCALPSDVKKKIKIALNKAKVQRFGT